MAGAVLVVAIVIAYSAAWRAGFIWDDDLHLTRNPAIVGEAGLKSVWITSAATYYPLTTTTFWIEHALWGLAPGPYHIVNILIHATCAILLWRLLVRLKVRGSWLGAAIWALHPVQVESVAWITELKNTQSCLFYLLSISFFVDWLCSGNGDAKSGLVRYVLSLVCAILAVLSKTSTVMLPVVLLICGWWLERRWRWRNLIATIPFFLVSALASVWTIWEQKFHSGALGPEWTQTWRERVIVSALDIWFYIGKLVWPHPLIFQYPRWQIDASRPLIYLPLMAAIASAWWLWRGRNTDKWRPVFICGAYFLVSLFPVLDFFNVYYFRYSFVGDHFQYLASMGPLALAGAGLTSNGLVERKGIFSGRTLGIVLLLILISLTWWQTRVYADIEKLWRTTIAANSQSWLAHTNLGAHLGKTRREEEAIAHLQKAREINPKASEPWNGLSAIYLLTGRTEEAASYARQAVAINPKDAEGHGNLGGALLQMGRVTEAIAELQKSIELDPSYVEVRSNLGYAFSQIGRMNDSLASLQKAVEMEPDYVPARYNLANTLVRLGRTADALMQLEIAIQIDPNDAEAKNNMAWILATAPDQHIRDGAKAAGLAKSANELTGQRNPVFLATLAAASANNGDFAAAQEAAERALRLAMDAGNAALATGIRRQLELYRLGQPFRDESVGSQAGNQ